MSDADHELGFWIEGAAYLWAPGQTRKECKRFYILNHDTAALFDRNDNILDLGFINTAMKRGFISPHELFSLIPHTETIGNYMLTNCFLVWTWDLAQDGTISLDQRVSIEGTSHIISFLWTDVKDIRVEGNSLVTYPIKRFPNNLVKIINPEKEFSTVIQTYPARFGSPYELPPFDIKEPIVLNFKDKKYRSFRNLADVQKSFNLSLTDLKRVHSEALQRTLFRTMDEGVALAVQHYIIKLKLTPLPDSSLSGWQYNDSTSFASAHILYETLIGKRPVYIWRDVTINVPKQLPSTFELWSSVDLLSERPSIVESFASEQNSEWRDEMEDEAFVSRFGSVWFAGVLDGHGGDGCSKYFSKVLPTKVFERYTKEGITNLYMAKRFFEQLFLAEDEEWFRQRTDFSGTTFTGVLITENKVYTINLGDSRTVLELEYNRISHTIDHKPDTEEERIKKVGGYVAQGRVQGILGVARALGDIAFKFDTKEGYKGESSTVSPVPIVNEYHRSDVKRILIACDGVFDVLNSVSALEFKDASLLVKEAIAKKSTDNITALFLNLN